jgi:membrane-associated phospholipid phosphatase
VRKGIVRVRDFLYRIPLVQRLGIQLIIGMIVSLACLGIFAAIAEDVVERDKLVAVDLAIANALYEAATPTSIFVYQLISLAGLPGLWILGILVGVFLMRSGQRLRLAVWIIALVGGILLNDLLKFIFARERPAFVTPLVIEQNFSFPSGHAMMALIGYGLLAYFVWDRLRNRYWRIVLVFAISLLVILIGISRMTLGVHYLSDVVAGFAAGGVWIAGCITAMETIQRKHPSDQRTS